MPDQAIQEPIDIGSINGGISRQPPHLRFPSQLEEATNCLCSPDGGLSNRPGTRLHGVVTSLTSGGDYRLHPIDRDGTEKYIVLYGPSGHVRVFEPGDVEATVTIDATATTYLSLNSAAADQIRVVTIADVTLFANTTVAVGSVSSADYTLVSAFRDYDVMTAATPAHDTRHRALNDTPANPKGYWYYDVDAVTFATLKFAALNATWANIKNVQLDANNPAGFDIFFQRVAVTGAAFSFNNATKRLTKVGAFTGYSGRANEQIKITGGTAVVPDAYPIAAVISNDTVELFDSIAGGGSPADVTVDGIGIEYGVMADFRGRVLRDLHDVAGVWQEALWSAGAEDALMAYTAQAGTGGYFTITCPYRGTGAKVHQPTSPGAALVDMTNDATDPFYATGTTNTIGTGAAVSGGDTMPISERWTAIPGPRQAEAQPDSAKMPFKLTRTAAGSPATFTLTPISYNPRTSGDKYSNPLPKLWANGRAIADMAYQSERLVLGGGESLAYSQAGDLFNFYADRAGEVIDSDAIDITVGGGGQDVAIIDRLVPFRRGLTIVSKAGRTFRVDPDGPLTPESAAAIPGPSATLRRVRPSCPSTLLYMLAEIEGGTTLLEQQGEDVDVDLAPNDAGAHVRGLLPASIRTLAHHPTSGTVFVLPTAGNAIYVYRSLFSGVEKVWSAWAKWTFEASYNIVDIVVLRDELWMLVKRGSVYTLEYIPVSGEVADTGYPYAVHLDRRMSLTGVHAAGTTTWTLPVGISDTSINRAVLGPAFGASAGTIINVTSNGTVATAAGNYSAGAATLGKSFTMTAKLSRIYRRDRTGRAIIGDSVRLLQGFVDHVNTLYYKLKVTPATPPTRSVREFEFSATTAESGRLRAGVRGKVDDLTIEVENDTAKPCTLAAVQFIAEASEGMR